MFLCNFCAVIIHSCDIATAVTDGQAFYCAITVLVGYNQRRATLCGVFEMDLSLINTDLSGYFFILEFLLSVDFYISFGGASVMA